MTRSAVNGGKHGVMALINIQRVLAAVWVATLSSRKATVAASMNSRLIVHVSNDVSVRFGSWPFSLACCWLAVPSGLSSNKYFRLFG